MVILAIMGLIVIFAGILLGIKVDKGDGYTLLVATVFLTGGLLVGIGCGLSGASNPEIILAEDINYKSIDLQNKSIPSDCSTFPIWCPLKNLSEVNNV